MSEGILNVTDEDYEEMKANGITDESLLKPGTYKLRRRVKTPVRDELHRSNTKVEFPMKLDLDLLKHFQSRAGDEQIESLQRVLNEILRDAMQSELELTKVEDRLLKDKRFIQALAEEVKNAA